MQGVNPEKLEEGSPVQPVEPKLFDNTHCVVGGAHAFILKISSFFGLAPLRFESYSNGYKVTLSKAKCIYSLVLVTILVITAVYGLITEINVGTELSVRMATKMSQVVSTCDVLVVVITALCGVYGAPKRMRQMLIFMKNVTTADHIIGARYSVAAERKVCVIITIIMLCFTALLVADFTFYVEQGKRVDREWEVVRNYLSFYILWYVVMLLELQFAFTALSIRDRFAAVNDALALTVKHICVPVDNSKLVSSLNMYAIRCTSLETQRSTATLFVNSVQDSSVIIKRSIDGVPRLSVPACDAIQRLALVRAELCEVVRRVDDCYGVPLIMIITSTLLHLVVTPYFLIMEIIVSTNRVYFLVLQFVWCLIHMMRMIVVGEPCHHTIAEGKRTEWLVCTLMASSPNGALASQLELFWKQLMMQTVTYAPMGFCTLHRPLIASIIGAVTTYLVILIQFQRYTD